MNTERAQQLLEFVCQELAIETPELQFKEQDRGGVVRTKTAEGTRTVITLPTGVFDHGEAFLKYYIVHECSHLITDSPKHDKAFKQVEADNLAKVFNIGITHSRAFPKTLRCLISNVVLWGQEEELIGLGPCITCIRMKH